MEYTLPPIERQKKLAVLIDADNAQASIIKNLLDEVAKYGVASVKRIYGNWTTPHRSEERRVGKECKSRWATDH